MKIIENRNRVDKDTLKTYEQIDVKYVIKEWLLLRDVGICQHNKKQNIRCVKIDDLVYMALIAYGLKSNATNKMYVGYWVCVGANRQGLWHDEKYMEVPDDIYQSANEENKDFRVRKTLSED